MPAVAAVAKLLQAAGPGSTGSPGGSLQGGRAVVTAGTGPVGVRAAGLLAKAGANVVLTSRRPEQSTKVIEGLQQRFGDSVRAVKMADSSQAAAVIEGARMVLNAGGAGICLVPRDAWTGRAGLRAAADLNAVPPLGIEGIEVTDDGKEREGVIVFGALGVGGLKMKVHKACIARLFEQNDLVLDAETISEIARALQSPGPESRK